MKDERKAKIAIIGLGNIGQAIATNLIKNNRPVIVAAREITKASTFAEKLGGLATPMGIKDAIKEATIIIPGRCRLSYQQCLSILNQMAGRIRLAGHLMVFRLRPVMLPYRA